MSDVPTPGSTLGDAVEDGATEAASAAADAAGSSGGGMGIVDILMHTEPDLRPAEVQQRLDAGPAVAHATIFVRKIIHAAAGVGEKAGVPALVNAGAAGYHWFTNLDVDDDQEDDEDGDDFDVEEVV
ncbi:hypothetical protein [Haloplanus pelagicus]|jgi:hypothetical protein|uniref:hypothetical protein n=1 Tax=Haloplanus pelagicus TaxID=2949995 RepID=UPI00203EAC04|nr:hypothetical protein [Haloplanus sp. HW8-1]